MYNFKSRDELVAWLSENIITTAEAAELLGCSRQNIDDLIKRGKLKPIKSINYVRLFLKDDIVARLNQKRTDI